MIIMDFLYLNDCNISDDLKTKLSDLTVQDEVAFLRCAKAYSAGNTAVMKKLNDLQCLAVALKAFEFTHKKYEEKGIEDSIFFDTLSDLGIWCRSNHNEGLENYNWIRHHVSFKLFKLGRLQFQIYECKNPTMRYAKLPFKYGDTVLNGLLYDTALAQEISRYFPLTISAAGFGGREYYGVVEFYPENWEGGQTVFENGEITYCEAHHNMAIFYAQTDDPILSVEVAPIGKVTSDLTVFDNLPEHVDITFAMAE